MTWLAFTLGLVIGSLGTLMWICYIDSACAKQCWANMLAAAPEAKP